jgi:DNA polymerase I-like protein with 3'-5' exonuclease and polymerase domains/5'-3' exonuclease
VTRIAFDMSSVMWTSLLVGKDEENGREVPHPTNPDKKCWVNSQAYGYENAINMMVSPMSAYRITPINTLLVFEGMASKKPRLAIDPNYKAGRDKDRPKEAYDEFEKLRTQLRELWLSLGAQTLSQSFVEGDDILAWLAAETEEDLVIVSRDRDMVILDGVNKHGAKVTVVCGDHKPGENPYGPWDLKLLPVYKALVGDANDGIKGVVGFGDKKWIDFLVAYGEEGAFELMEMLEKGNLKDLAPLAEPDTSVTPPLPGCKLCKKILEASADAIRCYRLGKLYPGWVNTFANPIEIKAGMVKPLPARPDERLKQWYGRSRLVTIDNQNEALKWMESKLLETAEVSLDIESSTPDESDEWLEAMNDPEGVDQLGQELTGMSLTFGDNNQYTLYFSVDHADTANVSSDTALFAVEMVAAKGIPLVIQNVDFELTVLFQEWGAKIKDRSCEGFLPNVLDTAIEASYVNENIPRGLKGRSKLLLGYEQQTYDQTTLLSGKVGTLFKGGRQTRTFEKVVQDELLEGDTVVQPKIVEDWEERRYKMKELPATHVFGYGIDDTICTAALHNHYRLVMQLEHSWQIYLDVEIPAAYQHAKNYIDGTTVSIEKSNELMRIDDATSAKAWETVSAYLIEQGFEGSVTPQVDNTPLTPADVKEIYDIWANVGVPKDAPGRKKLETMIRTPAKLVTYLREVMNEPVFAMMVEEMMAPQPTEQAVARMNAMLAERYDNEPENPLGSPKKMAVLMYDIMKLPIRVRNKVTDDMRAAGKKEGNPKTDALAIDYALRDGKPEQQEVLKALKLMQMVRTRHGLYYDKYPLFVHWKTGKVHSRHNQASANTRRATESGPNKQQLPKHMKIEGEPPRYREVIVPHCEDAVVVSMDFESQELVILAEETHDKNLIEIFVPPPGGIKKSQHTITGLGIFLKKEKLADLTYEQFDAIVNDKTHPQHAAAKVARALGKKLNFTAEYGAMARKVMETLLLDTEDEAQDYLDAREEQFPQVKAWKLRVIEEVRRLGIVWTRMGAPRHLREAMLADSWSALKAERQAINMKIQGSAAEQTKLAEGRMWKEKIFFKFDAVCYGPIHDEVVASVRIKDLEEFLPLMHKCMVAPYGGIKVVPITSTISFGPDFYRQIEIGAQPTPEAIAKGLQELAKMREKEAA